MTRARLFGGAVGVFVGVVLGCPADDVFRCRTHDQCVSEGGEGRCESTGYCSFPNETCPSGYIYSSLAGEGLSGVCVGVPSADGGTAEGGGSDAGRDSAPSGSEGVASESDDGVGPGPDTMATTAGVDSTGGVDNPSASTSSTTTGGNGSASSGTTDPGTTDPGTTDDGTAGGCGNGSMDPGEACDGAPPPGSSCSDFGYSLGTLTCAGDCTIDISDCSNPVCGESPPAPMTACPAGCDSCDATFGCVINCTPASENCDNINCPNGWPCTVSCSGGSTCNDSVIECPDEFACRVGCGGASACTGLEVRCSSDGPCALSCNGSSSCEGASVDCGSNYCGAACDAKPNVAVTCGDACECEESCG